MTVSTSTATLFESDAQQKALWICIGVSVLLHIAILAGFTGMREGKQAPASIKVLTAKLPKAASLAPPAAEIVRPPDPPPPPVPQAKPQPVPPPQPAAKAVPVAPKPEAVPVPSAPVTPVPPAPAAASSTPVTPVPPAPSAAAVASVPSSTPEPAARSSDANEAGSLDQYRLALIGAARRYKRYPAQAMQNGWTGKVEIRLVIGGNGMIQSAAVKTSTGYSLLDDTALDMIKKAKPLTQIPPALRGKEFSVDVPVIFDLTNG